MSTTDPQPADDKPALPKDATPDERRHFELTGTLALYTANREAEEAVRAQAKARTDAAELIRLEVQLAHVREQNARAATTLKQIEAEKANVHQHTAHLREVRPEIVGGERLSTETRRVINRIFTEGAPHWTHELQQSFVDTLLAMNPHALMRWTMEMLDGLGGDAYSASQLTPRAIMRGFTGLKQLVGERPLLQLGGPSDRKALEGGSTPRPPKKKGKKVIKARRVTPEIEDDDEEESDTYDESPQGHPDHAGQPWGDEIEDEG